MRHILDTGVFFRPAALEELSRQRRDVIVPAVVFAERVRQLRRDNRPVEAFLEALERNHWFVESFTTLEALNAPSVRDDRLWRRHARDAMIAGHVRDGDALWTTNPEDFRLLGLRLAQLRAV